MKRHSAPSMAATLSLLVLLFCSRPLNGQATNVFPSSGNVGIGTTSPSVKLHIVGGAQSITGAGANLNISPDANSSAGMVLQSQNTQIWGESALYLLGGTNGSYLQSGAGLGIVDFRNLAWGQGASILGVAVESHSAGTAASELRFATTVSGATAATQRMVISSVGNVGIGTTSPQYKLAVNGSIGAKDIIVTITGWPDYVFRPGYRLRPLSEVSAYIQKHQHLPDIPTEAEVKEKGVSLGEMQAKLLAKIEELTLHMIQQHKENNELRERIAQLETRSASSSVPAGR